ncbi:MAG TPA: hypothetical protein VFF04_05170, partial [Candidatus Babeliales bacterium]|nr:hypothetical protein [Candidatus Babeliales bacterium]
MKMLYALLLMLSVAVVQASETQKERKTELSFLETPAHDAPSSDESSIGSARSDSDHSPEQHLKVRPRSKTAGELPPRMAAKESAKDHKSGATVHFVIEKSDKDATTERKARIEATKLVQTVGKQDKESEVVIEPTKSVLALLTDTMAKHTKSPGSGSAQRRKTVHS